MESFGKGQEDVMRAPTNASTDGGHGEPRLEKSFSVWSLGALCLCLMATWEALSSVVAQALISGGAPCLFYNYIISFLGTLAIAASLAELASMYPTAGGQYHWVAVMAPLNQRLWASWFTAWISIGGQTVLTAPAAFAGGLQLQALITLNHTDTYTPQRWQGMLFYWLVLAYSLTINVYGHKLLPHTNSASGVLHIAGFLIIVCILGAMAPKESARYVFVDHTNSSGWPNDGIAWVIGLLSSVYPFLGYDAATHISEEIPNPKKNVPLAIMGSVSVNGVIGFIYCLILLFSLGDLDDLLATPTGFPFIQLFYNVTNSHAGASIMTLIVSLVAIAANSAGLTSTSRTFWSFARDDAMPAARFFTHLDPGNHLPVRMIVLVSVLQMLLGIIYLDNTTAFNAILSMAILGMYLSYALPIAYMLFYGRASGDHEPGPFKMGSALGMVVNTFVLVWLVFAMFFSTWPNFYPVSAVNMNYSTVVLSGWVAFGAVYFILRGRHKYVGPVIELDSERGVHVVSHCD